MERFAERALPPIRSALEILSSLLLFAMMMLTFVDVVGRYIFTAPIFGAAEMIQFLLAITLFAGLGLVNANDNHITVELFDQHIRRSIPRAHHFIVQGFSVFVMAIITWQLSVMAFEAHALNKRTIVLQWPLLGVTGAVAALSALSLVMQVLGLARATPPHDPADHAGAL